MPYSLQSFVLDQVLTAAQMNQVEANIKDHVHGVGGVAAGGISWSYTDKSAGFTAQASDAGAHFMCTPIPYSSGTMVVDLDTIGNLGAGWSATFTNVGSRGCILIDPSTTEKIDAASEFCLGIGETATVHTDGSEFFVFGTTPGEEVLIHTDVSSTSNDLMTVSYNLAWDSFESFRIRVLSAAELSTDTLITIGESTVNSADFAGGTPNQLWLDAFYTNPYLSSGNNNHGYAIWTSGPVGTPQFSNGRIGPFNNGGGTLNNFDFRIGSAGGSQHALQTMFSVYARRHGRQTKLKQNPTITL